MAGEHDNRFKEIYKHSTNPEKEIKEITAREIYGHLKKTTNQGLVEAFNYVPSEYEKKVNEIEKVLGISIRSNRKQWIDADFEDEQLILLSKLIGSVYKNQYEDMARDAFSFLKQYELTQEGVDKLSEMYHLYYKRYFTSLHNIGEFFKSFEGDKKKRINIMNSKTYKLITKYINTPQFSKLWLLNYEYDYKLDFSSITYNNIVVLVDKLKENK